MTISFLTRPEKLTNQVGKVVELSPQGFGRIVFDTGPAVFFSFDRVEGFAGVGKTNKGGLLVGSIEEGSKVSFDAELDGQANTYVATSVSSLDRA